MNIRMLHQNPYFNIIIALTIKPNKPPNVKKTTKVKYMESDEKYIKKHFGKEQHFIVPDGYLDGLVNSVLNTVNERVANQVDGSAPIATIDIDGGVSISPWLKWRKYVAVACLLFICVGATAYLALHDKEQGSMPSVSRNSIETATYTYDEIADFSMLDNDDIYSLVASN